MTETNNEKILFVTPFPDSADMAREMAPRGFDFIVTKAHTPEYEKALGDADYLVGFVAGLIREELYAKAPNLKLIQLLSAGYDDADITAARAAGLPVSNNGGANSVAVSEHAIMLMLAVSRQLLVQHRNVSSGAWRGITHLESTKFETRP